MQHTVSSELLFLRQGSADTGTTTAAEAQAANSFDGYRIIWWINFASKSQKDRQCHKHSVEPACARRSGAGLSTFVLLDPPLVRMHAENRRDLQPVASPLYLIKLSLISHTTCACVGTAILHATCYAEVLLVRLISTQLPAACERVISNRVEYSEAR